MDLRNVVFVRSNGAGRRLGWRCRILGESAEPYMSVFGQPHNLSGAQALTPRWSARRPLGWQSQLDPQHGECPECLHSSLRDQGSGRRRILHLRRHSERRGSRKVVLGVVQMNSGLVWLGDQPTPGQGHRTS